MKSKLHQIPSRYFFLVIIMLFTQSCYYVLYRSNEKVGVYGKRATKYPDPILNSNYVSPKQLSGTLYVYYDDIYNDKLSKNYIYYDDEYKNELSSTDKLSKDYDKEIKEKEKLHYELLIKDSISNVATNELRKINMFNEVKTVDNLENLNLNKNDFFVRVTFKPYYGASGFTGRVILMMIPGIELAFFATTVTTWPFMYLRKKQVTSKYEIKLYDNNGNTISESCKIDTVSFKVQTAGHFGEGEVDDTEDYSKNMNNWKNKVRKKDANYLNVYISKQLCKFFADNYQTIKNDSEQNFYNQNKSNGYIKNIYKEQIDYYQFAANSYEKLGFGTLFDSRKVFWSSAYDYREKLKNKAIAYAKADNNNQEMFNKIMKDYKDEENNISEKHDKAIAAEKQQQKIDNNNNMMILGAVALNVFTAVEAEKNAKAASIAHSSQQNNNSGTGNTNSTNTNNNKPYGKCLITVTNNTRCNMYVGLENTQNQMCIADMASCSQIRAGQVGTIIVSPASSYQNNYFNLTLKATFDNSCNTGTIVKSISGSFQTANNADQTSSSMSVNLGDGY